MPCPVNKIYAFLSFVFGIGILYFLVSLSNVENIPSLLLRIDAFTFLLIILLTFGIAVCASLRWMMLVKRLSPKGIIHFHTYIKIFLIGRLGSFFLPKEVSDIGIRSLILTQKKGVTGKTAVFSTVLDRASDLLVIAIFLLPSVLYLTHLFSLAQALLFLLLLLSGLLFSLLCLMPMFTHRFTRRFLCFVFFLSLFRFVFVIVRFYLIGKVYGVSLSLPLFFLLTPVAQMGYVVSLTPGGLGFLEATWYGILSYLSIAEEAKIAFVLGQRILTFLAVVVCLLFVHVWRRK